MPINRNTLLRYKTIDRMLQSGRRATLDELIDACNDTLYYTNGYGNVSRRTIQHDIQEMRYSQSLGYYAPIIVVDKKYYKYEDSGYSIMQIPLSVEDLSHLAEAVDLLKQMSSFNGFGGVEDVVNRLEDYVASMRFKADPVILLESNDRLCGLEHITSLHEAIVEKKPLEIKYKPFNSPEALVFCFSPYILKEFRNRWFVFGRRHDKIDVAVVNLALDRIEGIVDAPKSAKYQKDNSFQPSLYFKDIVGVTRYEDSLVEQVVFSATVHEVPYIRTKPIHHSQREIESLSDGKVLFSIDVIPNRELERDLLAFGDGITVLSPQNLVERLQARLQIAVDNYKKSDKI